MSDWDRSTREMAFDALKPEAVAAVDKHIELHNLGPILTDHLICIETISIKTKKGLFGKSETVITDVILTPRWLVWVISGEQTNISVLSARLADITIVDYEKSPFYKMVPDNGVEVSGSFTDANEKSTSFIGLGKDAAGDKFKEMLIESVQDAKK